MPISLSASTIGIQDSLWSAPGLLALWTAEYTRVVGWEVEYTDEFGAWWAGLSEAQQDRIAATVRLLAARGPSLPFPHSSAVNGSRHQHMRELRVQSRGNPLRIFYAFDPRRTAILLIGGDKTGNNRYEQYVPLADALYDTYLEELRAEGLI